MLVRMLVGISGPLYTLAPGDEFHFPDDEAARLIAANFAVPVAHPVIEAAILSPAAEKRTPGRPKKVG